MEINFWNNLRWQFNVLAKENDWEEWPDYRNQTWDGHQNIAYTEFDCTVVGLYDKSYGKFQKRYLNRYIIMEYEYYLKLFADSTVFNETIVNS